MMNLCFYVMCYIYNLVDINKFTYNIQNDYRNQYKYYRVSICNWFLIVYMYLCDEYHFKCFTVTIVTLRNAVLSNFALLKKRN